MNRSNPQPFNPIPVPKQQKPEREMTVEDINHGLHDLPKNRWWQGPPSDEFPS